MSVSLFPVESKPPALSGRSIERALEVLAAATQTTLCLFGPQRELILGPLPGSDFIKLLVGSSAGREAVVATHRHEIRADGQAALMPLAAILLEIGFDHYAVPVVSDGEQLGTITIGDRGRKLVPPELVARLATGGGVAPDALTSAAENLKLWDAAEASAVRDLVTLTGEFLAHMCRQDQELQRRIDELSAVYNISALVAGNTGLQDVLNKTARIVCEVMHVKACSIRLLDDVSGSLQVKSVHNLSEEYINKGPVTLEQNPIDLAAIQGEMVRIVDAPNDPRTRYPEEARREGIVSGLVCGLIYHGKPVGVLRVYTDEPHVFSAFEEALLRAVSSHAAASIMNARLLAETIEAERYARQLAYAGEVQRRMIPASPPVHAKADIAAVYRPTYQVGGDFYDFLTLPKGNLGIVVADVSGKGVPASLQMASLRAALRVNAHFTYDINRIMSEVNRQLCRDTTSSEFATAVYGVLTPDASRFTYCNAGHCPPMLLRNGKIQSLEVGGMALGIDPPAAYDRDPLALQPGDSILFYTDGLPDALNFNDERFGTGRATDSFLRHADKPAQLLVKDILWDLRRFRGLADRVDDVTIVVMKIR